MAIGIVFGFLTRAPVIVWTGLAVLVGVALGGYFADNRSLFVDSLSVAAGTTVTGVAILVMDDARPRDRELIFNTWLVAMVVSSSCLSLSDLMPTFSTYAGHYAHHAGGGLDWLLEVGVRAVL